MKTEQPYYEDKTTVFITDNVELESRLVPKGFNNAAEYLQYLAFNGLNRIFPNPMAFAPALSKRLEEELFQITSNGSENIFLIVHDYVQWAKKRGILCSPGRGSVPSSFVCYCLGITEIDPIINELVFERFFHFGNKPEICIEVELNRKQEIVNYITEKYNDCCVSVLSPDDKGYIDCLCCKDYMAFPILGIKILSALRRMELAIQKVNSSFSLDTISENDTRTFKMLSEEKTSEIYLLENPEIQQALRELQPAGFEELAALISMNRPGPMAMMMPYVNGKLGKMDVAYVDEALKDVLEDTCGIVVYQEQLMKIIHDYAGFSYREADSIRRILQKKMLNKFRELKLDFVSKAQALGHDSEKAGCVFDFLYMNASFAFNKSHILSHAKLSYWQAYIKCHCPEVFTVVFNDVI